MPTNGWTKVSTVAILAIAVVVSTWAALSTLQALRSNLRIFKLERLCSANNTDFTCSFTNASDAAARGECLRGVVGRKDNASGEVRSMTLCSGSMAARESKTVMVPLEGRASDLCPNNLGGVDWSACDLTSVDVE